MEEAKQFFVDMLEVVHKDLFESPIELLFLHLQQTTIKDNAHSNKARQKGNLLFVKKQHSAEEHEAIFEFYCESIAHALPGSEELAFAYGNRSALLVHLKDYKKSIEDIKRALKIIDSNILKAKLWYRKTRTLRKIDSNGDHDRTLKVTNSNASKLQFLSEKTQYLKELDSSKDKDIALKITNSNILKLKLFCRKTQLLEELSSSRDQDKVLKIINLNALKIKLLCRKAQSLKELGLSKDQYVLDKAKIILNDIPGNEKIKKNLVDLVNKTDVVLKATENLKNKNENSFVKQDVLKKLKIISVSDQKDIFDSVSIKYDKNFGKYLVANRDFEPGEILYIEKLYASCLRLRKKYTFCDHCLNPCLALIPCNFCKWAMYCSEECRNEAFKSYHLIECSIIPIMMKSESILFEGRLPIRLLLMAVNEAGSITKLRAEVEKIDKEPEAIQKEFFTKKNYEQKFTAVYRLKSFLKTENYFDSIIPGLSIALIKLLLRDELKINKKEDLLNNEDAIFIGSLFLILWKIKDINSLLFSGKTDICNHKNVEDSIQLAKICCSIGNSLPLISSLINHSCIPNITRVVTEEQKMIVYTLQPIKKGSQLFYSYQKPFYECSKIQRQYLCEKFQFICNCNACKNNWSNYSQLYSIYELEEGMYQDLKKIGINENLIRRMLEIAKMIEDDDRKMNSNRQFNSQIIKDLSECMKRVFKYLPLHHKTSCYLYLLLRRSFYNLYSMKTLKFEKCTC